MSSKALTPAMVEALRAARVPLVVGCPVRGVVADGVIAGLGLVVGARDGLYTVYWCSPITDGRGSGPWSRHVRGHSADHLIPAINQRAGFLHGLDVLARRVGLDPGPGVMWSRSAAGWTLEAVDGVVELTTLPGLGPGPIDRALHRAPWAATVTDPRLALALALRDTAVERGHARG